MTLAAGTDIIEIERIAQAADRWGERFLNHVFTANEIAVSRGRMPELAARFAAKEAISKALGTGLKGISWREMEILPDARGQPHVCLHAHAQKRAHELGLRQFAISLSHSQHYALAFVVAL